MERCSICAVLKGGKLLSYYFIRVPKQLEMFVYWRDSLVKRFQRDGAGLKSVCLGDTPEKCMFYDSLV